MRDMVKRIVLRLFPELESKTHLPLLAVVVKVPDPPAAGGKCTAERPRYAVDVRLLTPGLAVDDDMPLLRDVPVAMTGAADGRGFAALPQPGTVVELAFAFGRQSLPFIRSVLPDQLALPQIDARSQRWQQTAGDFQEVDAGGSWIRAAGKDISDRAAGKITREAGTLMEDSAVVSWSATAPKIWLGSAGDNFLQMVSDLMATVAGLSAALAAHVHQFPDGVTEPPKNKEEIAAKGAEAATEKGRVELIKR